MSSLSPCVRGEGRGKGLWSLAVLVAALVLTGCGFTPLYADPETGPAADELRAIRVDPISAGRIGQRLEIAVRSSLNPTGEPTPARYRLRTTLATILSNLGVQSQGLATLGKIDVYATSYLSDINGGANLVVNTVHVANTFELSTNQYSTVVGEDDAAVRSVRELDQEIVTRLSLFFQRRLAEQKPKPG